MPKVPSSISGLGLWKPFGKKNQEHGNISLNWPEGSSKIMLEYIASQK